MTSFNAITFLPEVGLDLTRCSKCPVRQWFAAELNDSTTRDHSPGARRRNPGLEMEELAPNSGVLMWWRCGSPEARPGATKTPVGLGGPPGARRQGRTEQ